ncbi:MAG TPA: ATP-dependent DNA helicase, partial [Stellaceae bacterium]|nr:ATP-dependent DNA helicase [Stellaceae bacterium]
MSRGDGDGSGRAARRVLVPRAPVLVAGFREVLWLNADGEIETLAAADARSRVDRETPIVCHTPATARRLDSPPFPALDVLELFAFARPARFCVPTPRGLAAALGLPPPRSPPEACVALGTVARSLLEKLADEVDPEARAIAEAMDRSGWLWGPAVLAALPPCEPDVLRLAASLRVWTCLDEWSEPAPAPPPSNVPVRPEEARSRLAELLGDTAEPRPQQSDYAAAVSRAFAARDKPRQPQAVLAEAGT